MKERERGTGRGCNPEWLSKNKLGQYWLLRLANCRRQLLRRGQCSLLHTRLTGGGRGFFRGFRPVPCAPYIQAAVPGPNSKNHRIYRRTVRREDSREVLLCGYGIGYGTGYCYCIFPPRNDRPSPRPRLSRLTGDEGSVRVQQRTPVQLAILGSAEASSLWIIGGCDGGERDSFHGWEGGLLIREHVDLLYEWPHVGGRTAGLTWIAAKGGGTRPTSERTLHPLSKIVDWEERKIPWSPLP